MAGFLDRAKEQAQRGLTQGKQKLDEVQAQRAGNDLLKRLGAAYYAERRGSGSPPRPNRPFRPWKATSRRTETRSCTPDKPHRPHKSYRPTSRTRRERAGRTCPHP